jgi:hypothetical protein
LRWRELGEQEIGIGRDRKGARRGRGLSAALAWDLNFWSFRLKSIQPLPCWRITTRRNISCEIRSNFWSIATMSVLLETSAGDIVIDLLVDYSPKLCEK